MSERLYSVRRHRYLDKTRTKYWYESGLYKYQASFSGWTQSKGICVCFCTDNKYRLIPVGALVGFISDEYDQQDPSITEGPELISDPEVFDFEADSEVKEPVRPANTKSKSIPWWPIAFVAILGLIILGVILYRNHNIDHDYIIVEPDRAPCITIPHIVTPHEIVPIREPIIVETITVQPKHKCEDWTPVIHKLDDINRHLDDVIKRLRSGCRR